MATYIWICLLLVTVTSKSQANPSPELPTVEPICLQPPEERYYASLQDYEEPCQCLGAAMVQFRDIAITRFRVMTADTPGPDYIPYIKWAIYDQFGVDIDQDQDILDFACRLADVHTIDDLAELINAEEYKEEIANDYMEMMLIMARVDGFHGFRMGSEVLLAVTEALRDLVGQPTGPMTKMDVIQQMNSDVLADLLAGLEEQFGSGYLIYGMFYPYNEALVGVDHHVLADAVLRADVPCALGLTSQFQYQLSGIVNAIGEGVLSRELVDILLELYVAADQASLFHLQ